MCGNKQCCAAVFFVLSVPITLIALGMMIGSIVLLNAPQPNTVFMLNSANCTVGNATHVAWTIRDRDERKCELQSTWDFCVPAQDEAVAGDAVAYGGCGCERQGEYFCNGGDRDDNRGADCASCSRFDSRSQCATIDTNHYNGVLGCEDWCFNYRTVNDWVPGKTASTCYRSKMSSVRVCDRPCGSCGDNEFAAARRAASLLHTTGSSVHCWRPRPQVQPQTSFYPCGNRPCFKLTDPAGEYAGVVGLGTGLLVACIVLLIIGCCCAGCGCAVCSWKGAKKPEGGAFDSSASASAPAQVQLSNVQQQPAAMPMAVAVAVPMQQPPVVMAQAMPVQGAGVPMGYSLK